MAKARWKIRGNIRKHGSLQFLLETEVKNPNIYTYIHTYILHIHIYIYTYTYMYIYKAHTNTYTCVHTHTHTELNSAITNSVRQFGYNVIHSAVPTKFPT